MPAPKPLLQREKELQALLATPEGRVELRALAEEYARGGGRFLPEHGSLVTYILIHERQNGDVYT